VNESPNRKIPISTLFVVLKSKLSVLHHDALSCLHKDIVGISMDAKDTTSEVAAYNNLPTFVLQNVQRRV